MSSDDIAVSVRGLGKSYTIAHQSGDAPTTLAESVMTWVRRPFKRTPKETFWALDDVEFDIRTGEVVGIIGRNGAGKSTLLKILSRITEPTRGIVDLSGRVGSLLEVGTGFHPELTGRENIFLNGAILGMSRPEIRSQFDAIVDFAGVEKFLDTPVKRYSSGMYVRLAFAVAAHLRSEILIIDEVLAVGDQQFQQKCLGKMKEVAAAARTVLFVSHNMQAISLLCTQAILLQQGRVRLQGDVQPVISEYLSVNSSNAHEKHFEPTGNSLSLTYLKVEQQGPTPEFRTSRSLTITAVVHAHEVPISSMICGFILYDENETAVMSTFFNDLGEAAEPQVFDGVFTFTCEIPPHFLNEGSFRAVFDVGLAKVKRFTVDDLHYLSFDMTNPDGVGSRFNLGRTWRNTALLPLLPWQMRSGGPVV